MMCFFCMKTVLFFGCLIETIMRKTYCSQNFVKMQYDKKHAFWYLDVAEMRPDVEATQMLRKDWLIPTTQHCK